MRLETVPVEAIVIPQRARASVGNVLRLAESISRVGLLHPVVLNSRRELVAGGRRLEAVKNLYWKEVPCYIAETLDDAVCALQAERDENTCREPLLPTEMIELGRRLEELEKPKAKGRKARGANQHTEPSGKLPEASKGDTRDKVASALGVSGKTYEKAKRVVQAAKEDPERFGDLPAKMDAGGKVDPVFRELGERSSPKAKATRKPAEQPEAEQPPRLNTKALCELLLQVVQQIEGAPQYADVAELIRQAVAALAKS